MELDDSADLAGSGIVLGGHVTGDMRTKRCRGERVELDDVTDLKFLLCGDPPIERDIHPDVSDQTAQGVDSVIDVVPRRSNARRSG